MGKLVPYAGRPPSLRRQPPHMSRQGQKRSERIEMRLTPHDKDVLYRVATTTRRSLTSLIEDMIDELDRKYPA